jgi:hypothetical protein
MKKLGMIIFSGITALAMIGAAAGLMFVVGSLLH